MLTASDVAHFAPLRLVHGGCQACMTVSQQRRSIIRVKILPQTFFYVLKFPKLEESRKKNPPERTSVF